MAWPNHHQAKAVTPGETLLWLLMTVTALGMVWQNVYSTTTFWSIACPVSSLDSGKDWNPKYKIFFSSNKATNGYTASAESHILVL